MESPTPRDDSKLVKVLNEVWLHIYSPLWFLSFHLWRMRGSLILGALAYGFIFGAGMTGLPNVPWEGALLLLVALGSAYADGMLSHGKQEEYFVRKHEKLDADTAKKLAAIEAGDQ